MRYLLDLRRRSYRKIFYTFFLSGKQKRLKKNFSLLSRSDKIRTCDLYVPNVALYQTEPHSDKIGNLLFANSQLRKRDLNPYYQSQSLLCCQLHHSASSCLFVSVLLDSTIVIITGYSKKATPFLKKLR